MRALLGRSSFRPLTSSQHAFHVTIECATRPLPELEPPSLQTPSPGQARFYEKTAWDAVTCRLCPHYCSIAPSRSGICGVRSNRNGELVVDSWGKATAVDHVQPEDLPLFHYRPGLSWVRLAGRGCTMRCPFCDRWRYSQAGGVRLMRFLPEEAVALALEGGSGGISFGVNEPAPMHEFVYDTFVGARAAGLETHVATGGMWSMNAVREMASVCSAFTFGLKGLSEDFHQNELGSDLGVVLSNIEMLSAIGAHVEVSWVLIPGISDGEDHARTLVDFLHGLESRPPVILLPYRPDYTWKERSRPATMEDLRRFQQHLSSYGGACYILDADSPEMNTRCKGCGKTLVRRGMAGMIVTEEGTGRPCETCPQCNTPVPYVP